MALKSTKTLWIVGFWGSKIVKDPVGYLRFSQGQIWRVSHVELWTVSRPIFFHFFFGTFFKHCHNSPASKSIGRRFTGHVGKICQSSRNRPDFLGGLGFVVRRLQIRKWIGIFHGSTFEDLDFLGFPHFAKCWVVFYFFWLFYSLRVCRFIMT